MALRLSAMVAGASLNDGTRMETLGAVSGSMKDKFLCLGEGIGLDALLACNLVNGSDNGP